MALLLRASISTLLEHPFCKENTRAKTDGELSGSLPEAPVSVCVVRKRFYSRLKKHELLDSRRMSIRESRRLGVAA